MTKKPKAAKPTPDPVDVSDRAQLLAKRREQFPALDAHLSEPDSETGGGSVPSVPIFTVCDVVTGQRLGISLFSWRAALEDAADVGALVVGGFAWADRANEGEQYAGVVLRMGTL